jgi:UDP:flavonoid glycosyltransferase YjiC (YdhE family)
MRFTVVTFGSEGDTRPLAALCRGLVDAGHAPMLFAEGATLGRARELGVPCEALPGDVRSILPIVDPMQKLRLADIFKVSKDLQGIIAANMSAWIRRLAAHAKDSDALLFSSLALGAGILVGEELCKPKIGLWFQPVTPTREFNSPLMQPHSWPGWANLLTYRLLHRYMWAPYAKPTQAARKDIFGTSVVGRPSFDFPMLYGISNQLVARPADWPDSHRICGHWSLPAANFQPPADLAEFLAAGEPPIYAGFGTVSCFIRRRALTALIDAIAGRRTLFGPGWSRIDRNVLPANFHIVRDIPHEWLFPRTALVIHHGGAGTTHTAARAGVPQVVLPIGADQPFWASRAAAAGIAPAGKRNARLDGRSVARMIDEALRPAVVERARQVAAAMANENGIAVAIREIERLTHQRPN